MTSKTDEEIAKEAALKIWPNSGVTVPGTTAIILRAIHESKSAARQDTETEIWRERCAYAEGLGLCIGALEGVAVQADSDLRTKINEVIRQAEEKEREATSLTKPTARCGLDGRSTRGERNPQSKLTEADIALIRKTPKGQRGLPKLLGISRSVISLVRSGKSWKHV